MGRLFQYNRFGHTDNTSNKKDNLTRKSSKTKMSQKTAKCPAYSELYPEYNRAITTKATTTTTAYNNAIATTTETPTPTASTSTSTFASSSSMSATSAAVTTTATKSVELAIKKYQQWSSKFLPATTTTSTSVVAAATTASEGASHLSTSSSTTSSYSCTFTSGYHSSSNNKNVSTATTNAQEEDSDREMLVSAAVKRPRVYDCMRDFLRRKFFQQQQHILIESEQQPYTQQQSEKHHEKCETEEDVTSDYDELDILDTSYNADEEDATDCSSNCTYSNDSSTDEVVDQDFCAASTHIKTPTFNTTPTTPKTSSPQKSALSLNCWQNSNNSYSTTEEEEEATEPATGEHLYTDEDDSDAGISDCCQLINEKSAASRHCSPKKIQKTQRKHYHNRNNESELLQTDWYQPRITTKAALERLQGAPAGSFLIRRKARTYELCLRVSAKIKNFTVITTTSNNFKLKGARKEFSTLKSLVIHHSVMAEQLPQTLILPREQLREQKQLGLKHTQYQRYADDFDTYESLQILGILKSLQAKNYDCT